MAKGRARVRRAALAEALDGRFTDHHARLARMLLDQIDELGAHIETVTALLGVQKTGNTSKPHIFDRRLKRTGPRANPGQFRTRVITVGDMFVTLRYSHRVTLGRSQSMFVGNVPVEDACPESVEGQLR